jgi:predicted extracellular nuclease
MRTPAFALSSILFVAIASGCGGDSAANTAPTLSIPDIQGAGDTSPFVDQDVVIEGIVTGDFQDGDDDGARNLGGFYIQGAGDDDPSTSDGVFVFDGSSGSVDVKPGDRVRVSGTVAEHFGETQVIAASVTRIGTGSIEPTAVALPVSSVRNSDGEQIADLEAYEGMLVRFPQSLTVSQLRNLERFGEMLLSEGGRQYAFTNLNPPDIQGFSAHSQKIAGRRVHLDDGNREQNVAAVLSVRSGDEIKDLTGVIRYARGSGPSGTEAYRLMPTIEPVVIDANPRPGAPKVAGDIRIATFNVNNFFATIDDGSQICGPARDASCRGADSPLELSRQLAKIVTTIEMMDAHVVALVELENDDRASLQTIVDAVNESAGKRQYEYVDAGTIGDDTIKVGIIFQPGAVSPAGDFAILTADVDPRFDDRLNRPVLAQSFQTANRKHRFTVLALHLKSKGSSCATDGDPDVGDGQGNCSATRSLAAAAMADWIATDPTGTGTDNVVVIGDFNTHTMGDALVRLETAGYFNVAAKLIGAAAYSFEFNGQFGALDHAMASLSLADKVVAAVEWHINADEARAHDYNLEFGRDPSLFNPSEPYRSSDHDPLIIGIDFAN